MYLMQMGRIPLLSRAEEVDAAMKIDDARFLFRNSMLATDFMLRGAYDALQKVFNGELRLDRTIEVSVTNKAETRIANQIPASIPRSNVHWEIDQAVQFSNRVINPRIAIRFWPNRHLMNSMNLIRLSWI